MPDIGEAGRTAEMTGQEMQELARIALVGIEREGRQPALARQHLQPAFPGGLKVGFCRNQELLHGGPFRVARC